KNSKPRCSSLLKRVLNASGLTRLCSFQWNSLVSGLEVYVPKKSLSGRCKVRPSIRQMSFVKLKGALAAVNGMPLYAPGPTLKSPASDMLENVEASSSAIWFVHGGIVSRPAACKAGGVSQE